MGEILKQTQARRFKEQLANILKVDTKKIKTEFDDRPILKSAKVKYEGTLIKSHLNALLFLSDSWNSELEIKRSGAGMVINFKSNL